MHQSIIGLVAPALPARPQYKGIGDTFVQWIATASNPIVWPAKMEGRRILADQSEHAQAIEKKIQEFRDLFADAPEIGKKALENAIHVLKSQASNPPPAVESAGRVGARLGKVSELTIIVPLAPGGAKRLRAFLRILKGNLSQGADLVGTLHTMRFVFFDNDTRLLFATAYDGDWDTYIDDFVAKIPDYLDIIDSAWDGWPGIRSAGAKDYLVKHQITAEGWYVAYPDLTVAEIKRLQRIGNAVDEFLDKVG